MTDLFSDDDFDIPEAAEDAGDEFDLDSLRVSSARAGSMYDENMEEYEAVIDTPTASSTFSLGNFSSGQKLVLSILLVLDILAVGIGVGLVTGIIG